MIRIPHQSRARLRKWSLCLGVLITILLISSLVLYMKIPSGRSKQLEILGLLKCFHELSVAHQLLYFIDAGTLLGQVRHGGFIPHDDLDIDIGVPKSEINKLLGMKQDIEQKCGLSFVTREDYPFFPSFLHFVVKRAFARILRSPYSFIYLDIGDYDIINRNGKVYVTDLDYADKEIYMLYDDVYPIKECFFEDMITYCPNHPVKVVEATFGPDWRVPRDRNGKIVS